MGFEFMMCFIKEFKKENIQKNIAKYNSPKLDKNILSFLGTKFLLLFLLKLLISIVMKTIILKRTLIYEFIKG